MRNRFVPSVFVLAVLFACVAFPAFAADAPLAPNKPDSTALVNTQNVPGDASKGLFWNAKTITFHGEAVGEVMVRGDYAWIHLNDDAYEEKNVEEGAKLGGYNSGMAVWVPAGLTKQIDSYGDYKHEGSIVEIQGTFNAACKEHGGDMDIHATSLRVIRPGHEVVDQVMLWKVLLAIALVLVAAGLWYFDRRTRNRIAPHRGV